MRSRRGKGIYVASDFSPTILKSNLKWLRKNRLEEQATFMAFDAKAMPFRDNSIPAIVSNVGFPNIRNNGKAVDEAFRVLAPFGVLIANFMFTTESTENYAKAKELGVHQFYTRGNVEKVFSKAGFHFSLGELHHGPVSPTPGGIDALPIVQDTYSFCVIKATKPKQKTPP
jgi:ubiquinone/menaquinone biosynthesis C-methylase UbiE